MTGGKARAPRRLKARRVIITLQVWTDVPIMRLKAKSPWCHDDQMNGRVLEVEEAPGVNVVSKEKDRE